MNDLPWLPHLLRQMADTLPLDKVLAFARAYGGREIYVPSAARSDNAIGQRCGGDVLDWLVRYAPGQKLLVPKGAEMDQEARRAIARRALAQGCSLDEAAAQSGLHIRSISRLRARVNAALNSRQGSLFGDAP